VAQGNKAIGFLPMDPVDVIRLTTASELDVNAILSPDPDVKGPKETLDFYNDLALSGEIVVAPFLGVDLETGRITRHEGRHRAGALWREDPNALMWVAIELIDPTGHAVYYEEELLPDWRRERRYLDASDMPTVFVGQYRDWVKVEVDPALLWPMPR